MLILSPASSCSDESCDPSLGGTWLGFATAVSKASTIRFVTAARNMHLHSHLSPQGSPCAVPRGAGRVRRDWRRTLRFPRPLPTRASSLRALPRVSPTGWASPAEGRRVSGNASGDAEALPRSAPSGLVARPGSGQRTAVSARGGNGSAPGGGACPYTALHAGALAGTPNPCWRQLADARGVPSRVLIELRLPPLPDLPHAHLPA
jgi:hypothetical protein